MYAVARINTNDYMGLANLTDPSKQEYCDKHGYKFFKGSDDDFTVITKPYSGIMNFNKMSFVLKILKENPEIKWLLFCETDAMITNMNIPIEDKIDDDYHFIISVDRLNINAGNWLIRNSPEAIAYFEHIYSMREAYKDKEWVEQQAIIDTVEQFQDIIKIVPQKHLNCYEPQIYDYADVRYDLLGNPGWWEPGDWIVHWPGIVEDVRKQRAVELSKLIVR
jgi:galactosyl transferase GMA12/MNN10 family